MLGHIRMGFRSIGDYASDVVAEFRAILLDENPGWFNALNALGTMNSFYDVQLWAAAGKMTPAQFTYSKGVWERAKKRVDDRAAVQPAPTPAAPAVPATPITPGASPDLSTAPSVTPPASSAPASSWFAGLPWKWIGGGAALLAAVGTGLYLKHRRSR